MRSLLLLSLFPAFAEARPCLKVKTEFAAEEAIAQVIIVNACPEAVLMDGARLTLGGVNPLNAWSVPRMTWSTLKDGYVLASQGVVLESRHQIEMGFLSQVPIESAVISLPVPTPPPIAEKGEIKPGKVVVIPVAPKPIEIPAPPPIVSPHDVRFACGTRSSLTPRRYSNVPTDIELCEFVGLFSCDELYSDDVAPIAEQPAEAPKEKESWLSTSRPKWNSSASRSRTSYLTQPTSESTERKTSEPSKAP